MNSMTINLQTNFVSRTCVLLGALLLTAVFASSAAAVQDVMLQTMDGRVVTGIIDDQTGVGTLGTRVYRGQFLSSFLALNPGFFGLRTGDANMPPGAAGFPSQHEVSFDLLPMRIENVSSNLFYWDGSDANGGGVDLSDVDFVVLEGISWNVRDDNSNWFAANGTDQLVPGGVIDRTSADIWPDGVDSGSIHSHLALQLTDDDGDSGTSAPQGIYLVSWQARSIGFDTSDPFFFVFRTSTMLNAVRDVAANWVEANIETLISSSGLQGDYNNDGTVDAADYVLWRKGGPLLNEVHDPGTVSAEDYTEWRQRFGNTDGGGGGGGALAGEQPVPEPATWFMLVLALAGAVTTYNRRACR
jgi:hypothetical protein